MSHADISLIYEGPALENGAMDVRDLGPALLAFGNLIEAANRVVSGEGASAKVQVRTVGSGSFAIGLDITLSFLSTVRDFLAGPEATAAANLVAILTGPAAVTGVGIGAIALIRKLKGKGASILKRKEPGRVEVDIDGQIIEVDEVVARVTFDPGVRAALERVVAEPLSQDGIDAVSLGAAGRLERIEKIEGFAFKSPIDRENGAYEHRYRAPFSIVSLSFKKGNKWRLHDGKTTLNVTVLDDEFLRAIDESRIEFAKGDILICDVRVETREIARGLQAEYFIERVVDHRKPYRQASLFGPDEGKPVDPK